MYTQYYVYVYYVNEGSNLRRRMQINLIYEIQVPVVMKLMKVTILAKIV